MNQSARSSALKRFFDVAGALAAIALLAPVLVLITSIILLIMGWPVFFIQRRPGRNGATFGLIKFRTMNALRGPQGRLLPDGKRLTPLGRWLRATSIDELPELLNVLRGDMSLVGPRPLLGAYLNRYTPEQARRHEVKPGITGWAQINGRNALSWEEKFKLDVWYVDHHNLWLDLKIILRTIKKVLMREGISHAGEATMSEFMGSEGR